MSALLKSRSRREEVVHVLADTLVTLLLEDRRHPTPERNATRHRPPEVDRP